LARNYLVQSRARKGSPFISPVQHSIISWADSATAPEPPNWSGAKPIYLDGRGGCRNRYQADMLALSPYKIFEKRWATTLLEQAYPNAWQNLSHRKWGAVRPAKGFFPEEGAAPVITPS